MLKRIFFIKYQHKTKQFNIEGRYDDAIIIFQEDIYNKPNKPYEPG